MKKRNETKLGLDKLRITKLRNPDYIVGGGRGQRPPTKAASPKANRPNNEDRYRSDGDCP